MIKIKTLMGKWIVSYLLIVVTILGINSIIYYQSAKIIKNETIRANNAILNQVQIDIDNKIKDINKLMLNLTLDERIQGLMYTENVTESYQKFTIKQVMSSLKDLSTVNGFIENFFIYFKNGNFVIGPSFYYSSDIDAFNIFNQSVDLTYDQWKDIGNKNYNGQIININNKNNDGTRLVYIHSLPLREINGEATIVIHLNKEQLYDIVKNNYLTNQGSFVITSDKVCLFNTDNNNYVSYVNDNYKNLNKSKDIIETTIDNEDVVISYKTSSFNNIKYISIIPTKIFMEKSLYILKATVLCLILCLIFGIIAACIFTKLRYKPVDELVNFINSSIHKSKIHKRNNENVNEYDYIKNKVSEIISEKESVLKQMSENNDTMKQSYLRKLLKRDYSDVNKISNELINNDIKFISDNFIIVLIYIENDQLFFKDSKEDRIKRKKLLKFVIENVMGDLIDSSHRYYIGEEENVYSLMFNLNNNIVENDMINFKYMLSRFKSFFNEKLGISFSIAVSSLKRSFDEINEGYKEAKLALDYKQVIGKNEIIYYENLKEDNKTYQYTLEMEYKIINCIKAGEYEQVKKITDYIFHIHFANGTPSLNISRCLMFDLVSTMIKATKTVNEFCDETLWSENETIEKLLECQTFKEMKTEMDNMFYQICSNINKNKKNINDDRKDKIIKFIQENYNNQDLSVSMIADYFKVNSSYMSKRFKEQTGEKLLNYINKYRIDKAKKLLRKQDLSVTNTAKQVGFQNSVTLIRLFKKYEGVTPGKYKEKNINLNP